MTSKLRPTSRPRPRSRSSPGKSAVRRPCATRKRPVVKPMSVPVSPRSGLLASSAISPRPRGYAAALGQRNQDDPAAARKTKIASLEDEADRHLANAGMAAAAKDQERAKAEMRAYNAKQREIAKLEFRAEMEPDIDQRFQQFQRQQPMAMTPQLLQARDSLQREFPWLTTNKRALDATDAEVDRRMRSGQQFSYEMARVVAAEVQRDLNLKINTPPSERSRAAYQAPGGGEGEGGGEGPVTVRMGKAEKTMAHKLYPGLDPAEAEKKWAREVGAPEARRQAKAGR